jgi:RNA polymerase sigma factor (sigma-70 family)
LGRPECRVGPAGGVSRSEPASVRHGPVNRLRRSLAGMWSQEPSGVRLASCMAFDRAQEPSVGTSDEQLLREARAGVGESLGVLYVRHHEVVLAFLARRVRQPELAADLMAETFASLLALVRDTERDLPPVPVAWLLMTARNLLVDVYRRGKVDDRARRRLSMQPLVLDDRDLERVEQIASETDLLRELSTKLQPDQFQALRARVLDDREYADIAAELSCSESVVRKRVSRALGVLRRSLEATSNA